MASILFEHDVYFQSVGRQLAHMKPGIRWVRTAFEYMRALRYETRLLPEFDRVQVCSRENAGYILSFVPELQERIDVDVRAGIATARYPFVSEGREPNTMLFLGGFRHLPNQEGIDWFVGRVLPLIHAHAPEARLILVGSDPPPRHSFPYFSDAIELRGFVEDVLEPLQRYTLFVCPILSGSGMRVKLLEAFSSGIPVVSTRLGAEGLAASDGEVCALADDPAAFARKVIDLLRDPAGAQTMAQRARSFVEQNHDMRVLTARLENSYRRALIGKRPMARWVAEPEARLEAPAPEALQREHQPPAEAGPRVSP
jgi:glycosyltransferase involved in cell wall biosynthesis